MTTVIKGGTIVTADLTHKADILIADGKIAEIGPDLSGDEVVDASGAIVMPCGSASRPSSPASSTTPMGNAGRSMNSADPPWRTTMGPGCPAEVNRNWPVCVSIIP